MLETYKTAFSSAITFWESNITGYRLPDDEFLQGITITADTPYIDGVGQILGSAGPTQGYFRPDAQLAGDLFSSDVLFSAGGVMNFDSADVDNMVNNGSWEAVIRHEMAHVLGFGTLWGYFDGSTTYNDFYVGGSGQYTGAAGLAAYQAEFDPSAMFVPVELGGGDGTADGHWNEVDNGAGLTGITTTSGDDMRNELMTGWLNTPTFLSQTTLGQFYDLGYTVIPEPSPMMMIALVCAGGFWIRRRFYD